MASPGSCWENLTLVTQNKGRGALMWKCCSPKRLVPKLKERKEGKAFLKMPLHPKLLKKEFFKIKN